MPPTQDPNPTSPSSSPHPPSSTTPAPPPPPNGAPHNPPAEPHPPAHNNTTNQPHPRPLILALSGPTSSGKTSLATALHAIYPSPSSTLIHADDFYKPDHEIPFIEMPGGRERVRDWDCVGALDVGALEGRVRALLRGEGDGDGGLLVRQGNFEGGGDGVGEEGEGDAIKGISPSLITRLRSSLPPLPPHPHPPLIILDGFLLFGTNVPRTLTTLFDIKILLRATREVARERREKRNGYVTLEGFWEDPEGYFEGVVWPGYEREYGGVEGRVGGGGGAGDGEGGGFDEVEGVWCSDAGWGLERCLEWVVGVVRGVVEGGGKKRGGDAGLGA